MQQACCNGLYIFTHRFTGLTRKAVSFFHFKQGATQNLSETCALEGGGANSKGGCSKDFVVVGVTGLQQGVGQ